ncbi:alpha/beta fold hydrolase [Rhodopseudomonas sp. B29]|uniref:alpha/beta fold hydrolase n=1 Tax=Rhodopseudomonas sp. B29 TaxID=95607 RepID=UPI0004CED482|nr:alpha/beta fold hydrolase [Rhodopseudomonas sp. B29]
MKRPFIILACLSVVAATAYFTFSHWAIRHASLNFYDQARKRPVSVDLAVRRDIEMKAEAGMTTLPVAIISNGNTVKNTEYSFLANVLAARGYLVASIQQDVPGDKPLMTIAGDLYVGRLGVYEKGEKNILFTIDQLKKLEPEADFQHLTLVGHSNGGDISMFFAQQHPDMVRRVVTLDNLRVPFVTSGFAKILSFRSDDPQFKTDPGVLPDAKVAKQAGIEIVDTGAQHNELSDRGPDSVKERIQATLDQFLSDSANSKVSPIDLKKLHDDPRAMGP